MSSNPLLKPRLLRLALLLLLVPAPAAWTNPASLMSHPTPVVSTPTLNWAKPLADGPIRVLFVIPRAARAEPRLLAERIDLEETVVTLWDRVHLGFDPVVHVDAPEALAAANVEAAAADALDDKLDVIVLANIEVDALPKELRNRIVERVRGGAGLLLAHHGVREGPLQAALDEAASLETSASVTRGTPLITVSSDILAEDCVELQTLGDGRIVQLHWPGPHPAAQALIPLPGESASLDPGHLDNCTALIARALMWAAKRNTVVDIVRIEDTTPEGPNPEEIPPDLPKAFVEAMQPGMSAQMLRPYRVQFNPPTDRDYTLETRLRRMGVVEEVYTTTTDVPAGSVFSEVPLMLGAGRYHIDARLVGRKGVIDWFTNSVWIDGWPRMDEVRYEKSFLLPNDAVALSVEVPGVFSPNRSATIYARATDSFDRRVAEAYTYLPASGGTAEIQLNFADLIAPLVKVEVYALEGRHERFNQFILGGGAYDVHFFAVRQPGAPVAPQLTAAITRPWEPVVRDQLVRLTEVGFENICSPADPASLVAAAGAGLWMVPEIAQYRTDVARFGNIRRPCLTDPAFLKDEMQRLKDDVVYYWAGGPGRYALGNPNYLCASDEPVCQSPTCLADFRSNLDTGYGELAKLNEAWETNFLAWEEVAPSGVESVAAQAVDFRAYMDDVFTLFHGMAANQVREMDAAGAVGFRALSDRHLNNGYDWHGLIGELDWLAFAPDPFTVEALRSFRRADQFLAISIDEPTTDLAWLPWYGAFHQIAGLWYDDALGEDNTALAPPVLAGLQPSPAGTELQEAFRPIRNGIGQLLLAATRDHSGIALIDYPASRTLAHASAGYEIRDLQEAWIRMLEGLGYQFDVLDGRTLSGMDLKPYRVLIAPGLAAIDDGPYDAIQRFCESGGHLIADGPVGTHDQHARARPEPFSVKKATEGEAPTAPFLQLFPEPYPATALLWDRLPEIAAYLDASGCKRLASGLGPTNLLHGEAAQWTYGGGRIWGLLTHPSEEKSRISIDLPFEKDDVVYDLLSGEHVTRPHRADVTLHAGQAALFAALPYEVEDIAVLVKETVPAGQRLEVTAMLETKGGDTGDHFFQVTLTSADGQTLPFHDRVLRAPDGRLNTYLPIARNRPPGPYTLRVRDVLSGVAAAAEVVVASAPE